MGASGRALCAGLAFSVAAAAAAAQPARAQRQTPPDSARADSLIYFFAPLVVTPTRSPRELFLAPTPLSVMSRAAIRDARPNTVADLFRDVPGLDVTGVGPQQPRPVIRGLRGQRILLLHDGVRLNNARRQQDFGEIPALIDVSAIERVEVVRGPASVLYGSDAIGGVVNIITSAPVEEGLHGSAQYRFGSAGEQHKGSASVSGRYGAFDVRANAAVRRAGTYAAPAGSFGGVTLDQDATVIGTAVDDYNAALRLGWQIGARHSVFAGVERYDAEDSGFGAVAPDAYATELPTIEIRYPDQRFQKLTIGWSATDIGTAVADRLDLTVYGQDNERTLTFDLFQSFGPAAPPGAGLVVEQWNDTDLRTYGARLEAKKLAAVDLLLTYGLDFVRDDAAGADSSVTTVIGFGPPQREVSTRPQIPNAIFRGTGAFLQGEWTRGRATLVLGGRAQEYHAETRTTPGLDEEPVSKTNRAVVGSANVVYAVSNRLSLIGAVGRAFRSPNLIEYFFHGPTPEGNGFQVRNPDLVAETSLNLDVGVRYRDERIGLEAFAFRNRIQDGIRIEPTGETVDGLPGFRNVNVDELIYRGLELNGELRLPLDLSIAAGLTLIESENALDPSSPVGESYSSKLTGALRYGRTGGRLWAEYAVRHNGEQRDALLVDNPIGDVLPAFTVHSMRAGIALGRRAGVTSRIGITLHNLTDALYAESSNASFFRPEPGRSIVLTYDVSF